MGTDGTGERATFSSTRDAFFRGEFETVLRRCDALRPRGEAEAIEIDLLRARAFMALGRADRALDAVRRLHLADHGKDLDLTGRMIEGAALVRLSRVEEGLVVLAEAHRASSRAHPSVRAELAVNLGIAQYRKGQYAQARRILRTVPADADIIRARALVFEAWVAWDSADFTAAANLFDAALRHLESCRHYDRFVEAAALYGLAFLCAELPRLDLWPRVRERAERFDWFATGVVIPGFWLAIASSYVTEMLGAFDEAREWAVRAESAASLTTHQALISLRLAELFGRYGESGAHAYFVRKAYDRYEELRGDALLLDEPSVPLTLSAELAQAGRPEDAGPPLTYYVQAIEPRMRGTSNEAMLEAARAVVEGLLDDAAGRKTRAKERYADAFERYAALGFRRRAAIAAYRLAVLTGDERPRAFAADALEDAAGAYWLKDRLANLGEHDIPLTARQADVLQLLVEGKTNKGIAAVRGGSWFTARNIVRELLVLFGVRRRSQLVRIAIARGIVARRVPVD